MKEKIGKNVIKQKRRLKFRKELNKANQIEIQMKVLENLSEGKMTSAELRELIESLGGNHYFILPILKDTGLLRIERIGIHYIYSLKPF